MSKQKTISLSYDDFNTIFNALQNIEEIDDQFFFEDIDHLIKDQEYGIAGIKLLQLQDRLDAREIVYKIDQERKGRNELEKEKNKRGTNSV